jgi:hypothetical protein
MTSDINIIRKPIRPRQGHLALASSFNIIVLQAVKGLLIKAHVIGKSLRIACTGSALTAGPDKFDGSRSLDALLKALNAILPLYSSERAALTLDSPETSFSLCFSLEGLRFEMATFLFERGSQCRSL